jgi:P-type E1-E2 ATPase
MYICTLQYFVIILNHLLCCRLGQVAVAISVWRLQRARINVIESRRIILAGALDCVAFDKTGTLTENALRLEELWLQASPGGALEEVKVSGQPTATASEEEDEEEDGGSDEEEDCSEVVEHPFTAEVGAKH